MPDHHDITWTYMAEILLWISLILRCQRSHYQVQDGYWQKISSQERSTRPVHFLRACATKFYDIVAFLEAYVSLQAKKPIHPNKQQKQQRVFSLLSGGIAGASSCKQPSTCSLLFIWVGGHFPNKRGMHLIVEVNPQLPSGTKLLRK